MPAAEQSADTAEDPGRGSVPQLCAELQAVVKLCDGGEDPEGALDTPRRNQVRSLCQRLASAVREKEAAKCHRSLILASIAVCLAEPECFRAVIECLWPFVYAAALMLLRQMHVRAAQAPLAYERAGHALSYLIFEPDLCDPILELLRLAPPLFQFVVAGPGALDELQWIRRCRLVCTSILRLSSVQASRLHSLWNWAEFFPLADHRDEEVRKLAKACLANIAGSRVPPPLPFVPGCFAALRWEAEGGFDALSLRKVCSQDNWEEAGIRLRHGVTFPVLGGSSSSSSSSASAPRFPFVATSPAEEALRSLMLASGTGRPVLVGGPAGAGKTAFLRRAAELQGQEEPVYLFCDEQTDVKALLGTYVCGKVAGEFEWQPGVVTQALVQGRWVVLEDVDRVPAEILAALLPLADSRRLVLADRGQAIDAHIGFRLFGTLSTGSVRPSVALDERRSAREEDGCEWREDTTPQAMDTSAQEEELALDFAARVPAVVAAWVRVSIPLPKDADMVAIITGLHPELRPICTQLLDTAHALQAAISSVAGGWHLGGASTMAGPREVLRWCTRLVKAKLVLVPQFTEQARLTLLREALVALLGQVPDLNRRRELLELLAPIWNLPRGMVCALLEERPEVNVGSDQVVIGTVALPRKVPKEDLAFAPFAFTSVHARILQALAGSVRSDQPVLLVGDTGTGKTSVVQHLGRMMGQDVVVYNFSEQSESAELIGGFKPIDAVAKLMSELFAAFTAAFAQSFSKRKNAKLLDRASAEYAKQRWPGFLQVVSSICEQARRSLTEAGVAAAKGVSGALSSSAWEDVAKLLQTASATVAKKAAPHFEFREGLLVSALRSGAWVVLDEINLAPGDILQRIQGLIERPEGASIALPEAGDDRLIPHHNFRIFACMNPPVLPPAAAPPSRKVEEGEGTATDTKPKQEQGETTLAPVSIGGGAGIGKKELPPGIRARFIEVFVDEVQMPEDIDRVVRSYLEADFPSPPADAIVNFYLKAKAMCASCALLDGAGRSVWFSLRNLTRALRFAIRLARRSFKPTPGPTALAQGLAVGFATPLDSSSAKVVEGLIEKALGVPAGTTAPEQKRSAAAAATTQAADVQKDGAWISVEGFWIKAGPVPVDVEASHRDFVITASVRRNLRNLARLLSGGRFPILLEGPTSSGKTSLVKFLASLTGHEFVRINNHEQTDLQEYIGQYVCDPQTGQLVFQEGVLVRAARAGHWVVLDELNLAPGEVLEALNRLLDDNRELYIPDTDTIVKPHEDFMVFATQNPAGGAYGGRKLLSRAFRNRFMEAFISELPMQELAAVLHHRCQLPPSFIRAMLAVYADLQSHRCQTAVFLGRQSFMTVRDLLRWGHRKPGSQQELAAEGYALLAERLRKMEDREVVRASIEKHCPGAKNLETDYTEDPFVNDLKERLAARKKAGEVPPGGVGDVIWTPSLCRLVALAGRCVRAGEPALIIGETGGGKTMACQVLSWLLIETSQQQRLRILNCHQHTETADFIGALQPVRGRDGLLAAMQTAARALLPEVETQAQSAGADDRGKILAQLLAQLRLFSPDGGSGDPSSLSEALRAALARKALLLHEEHDNAAEVPPDGPEAKRRKLADKENSSSEHKNGAPVTETVARILALCSKWDQIFEWADGALVEAMRFGGAFLVDEISLAEDSVLERLNSVLEPEKTLMLAEKPIVGGELEVVKGASTFQLFATMNPGGDFGKRELSPALRNRFTEIWVEAIDFATPQAEALVLSRIVFQPLVKPLLRAVQWFNARVLHPLSIREVLGWAAFVKNATTKAKKVQSPTSTEIADADIRLAVEMYIHGGFMSLVDSLGLGNRMVDADAFAAIDEGDTKDNLGQLSAPQLLVLKHLLSQLEEPEISACMPEGVRDALRSSFAMGGFAWLQQSAALATAREGSLHFGPFTIDMSPGASCVLQDEASKAFDFAAPSAACNVGRLVRALQEPRAVLLEGPPGLGKTATVQALAQASGRQLVRINLSEQTDLLDLLGSDLPSADSEGGVTFTWRDGALLRAIRNGDWVLLDEINLAAQATLEGLNALLDHRRQVFLPAIGQVVTAGAGFRLFAAQNPVADGGGRKGLPRSFLNRFTRVVLAALSKSDLLHICRHRFGATVHDSHVTGAVELLEAMRLHSSGQAEGGKRFEGHGDWDWNLRDALRLCELLEAGIPVKSQFGTSAEMLLMTRLRSDHDRSLVRALVARHAPSLIGATAHVRDAARRASAADLRAALASVPESTPPTAGENQEHSVQHLSASPPRVRFLAAGVQIGTATLRRRRPAWDSRGLAAAEHAHQCEHLTLIPAQAAAVEAVVHAVSDDLKWPVLLVGGAASGKRSIVRWLASIADMPLTEVPLTPSMDASELLGCFEQVDALGRVEQLAGETRRLSDAMTRAVLTHAPQGESSALFAALRGCLLVSAQLQAAAVADGVQKINPCEALDPLERGLSLMGKSESAALRTAAAELRDSLAALRVSKVNASRFEWVDGPLVVAMTQGSWVLLSHAEHAAPAVLDRLNSVLEPNGFLLLTESGEERLVKPHRDFRIFFTMTSGGTTQQISRALRNRCLEVYIEAGDCQDVAVFPSVADGSTKSPAAGLVLDPKKLAMVGLSNALQSRLREADGSALGISMRWAAAALASFSQDDQLGAGPSVAAVVWACRLVGSGVPLHKSTAHLLAVMHVVVSWVWSALRTVASSSSKGTEAANSCGPSGREAHRLWVQQLASSGGPTFRSLHKCGCLLLTTLSRCGATAAAGGNSHQEADPSGFLGPALRHSFLQTYVAEVSGGPMVEQLFTACMEASCELARQDVFHSLSSCLCMELPRLRALSPIQADVHRQIQNWLAWTLAATSTKATSALSLTLLLERAAPTQVTFYTQQVAEAEAAHPAHLSAVGKAMQHPLLSEIVPTLVQVLAETLGVRELRAEESGSILFAWDLLLRCARSEEASGTFVQNVGRRLEMQLTSARELVQFYLACAQEAEVGSAWDVSRRFEAGETPLSRLPHAVLAIAAPLVSACGAGAANILSRLPREAPEELELEITKLTKLNLLMLLSRHLLQRLRSVSGSAPLPSTLASLKSGKSAVALPRWASEEAAILCLVQQLFAVLSDLSEESELEDAQGSMTRLRSYLASTGSRWDPDGRGRRALLLPLMDAVTTWGGLAPALKAPEEFLLEEELLKTTLSRKNNTNPVGNLAGVARVLADMAEHRQRGGSISRTQLVLREIHRQGQKTSEAQAAADNNHMQLDSSSMQVDEEPDKPSPLDSALEVSSGEAAAADEAADGIGLATDDVGAQAAVSAHHCFMVLQLIRMVWSSLASASEVTQASDAMTAAARLQTAVVSANCNQMLDLLDAMPHGQCARPLVKAAAELLRAGGLAQETTSEALLSVAAAASEGDVGGQEGTLSYSDARALLALRLYICDALEVGFAAEDSDSGMHLQLPFMLSPLTLSRHRPSWRPQVNFPAAASLVLHSGFKVAWALNQCALASTCTTINSHEGHMHRLQDLLRACRGEGSSHKAGLAAGDWIVLGQFLGVQFHGLALWSQQAGCEASVQEMLGSAGRLLAALGATLAAVHQGSLTSDALHPFGEGLLRLSEALQMAASTLQGIGGNSTASSSWPRPQWLLIGQLVIPVLSLLRHRCLPESHAGHVHQDIALRGAVWSVAALWRLQSGGGALWLGGVEASEEASCLREELLRRTAELEMELRARNLDRLVIDGVRDRHGGPDVQFVARELQHWTQEAKDLAQHCRLRPPLQLEDELEAFAALPAVAAAASDAAPQYYELCQEVSAFATTVAQPERILRLVQAFKSEKDSAAQAMAGAEVVAELHTVTIAALGFAQRVQARFPLHADLVGPVTLSVHGLLHGLHLTQRHLWLSEKHASAASGASGLQNTSSSASNDAKLGAVPQLPTMVGAGPAGVLGEDIAEAHPEVISWWLRWTGLDRSLSVPRLTGPRPQAILHLLQAFSKKQRTQEEEEATREAESSVPFRASKVLAAMEAEEEEEVGPDLFPDCDVDEMEKALGLAGLQSGEPGTFQAPVEEPEERGGSLYDLWSRPVDHSSGQDSTNVPSLWNAMGPGKAASAASGEGRLTDEQVVEICELSLEAFESEASLQLTEDEVSGRRSDALDASLEMCIRQLAARPSQSKLQLRAVLLTADGEAQLMPLAMVRLQQVIAQLQPGKPVLDPASIGMKRMAKQGMSKRLRSEAACAFYAECNPSIMLQLATPLRNVVSRAKALLTQFEAHPSLLAIVTVVEKITQLKLLHTTPMSAVTMLELLLGRIDVWEANACREVSMAAELRPLKALVVNLRERQILEWKQLCQVRQRHWERQGASWWCYLLHTLQSMESPRKLVDDLMRFVRVTPLIQFRLRLRMLAAACHLHLEADGPTSVQGLIALHVFRFSERWLPIAEKALKGKVETVDKEIQDLAGIVRWDMTNYHALKESVSRSHKQLSKAIKRYDDTLQELADPILAAGTEQLEPIPEGNSTLPVGQPRLSKLLSHSMDLALPDGQAPVNDDAGVRITDTEEFWNSTPSVLAALPTLFNSLTRRVARLMIEDTFAFGSPEGCSALEVADDLKADIASVFQDLQDPEKAVLVKKRRLQALRDECACLGITSRPMAGDALDVLALFQGDLAPRLAVADEKQGAALNENECLDEGDDPAAKSDAEAEAPPAKRARKQEWQDGPRSDRSATFESRANALWERSEARTYECMHLALRLHSMKNKPSDLSSSDMHLWLGLAAGCLQAVQWHRNRCVEFQGQLMHFTRKAAVCLLESSVLVEKATLTGVMSALDHLLEGLLQAQTVTSSLASQSQATLVLPAINAVRAVVKSVAATEEYEVHIAHGQAAGPVSGMVRVRTSFVQDTLAGVKPAASATKDVIESVLSTMPEAVKDGLDEMRALLLEHAAKLEDSLSSAHKPEQAETTPGSHTPLRELLLLVQASQKALSRDPSISVIAANEGNTEVDWDASELVPRLGVGRGDNLVSLIEVFPIDSLLRWLDRQVAVLPQHSPAPVVAPFVRQAVGIGKLLLLSALEANAAMVETAVNLMKLVSLLLEKGLGTKNEEEEEGEDGEDGKTDWAAGTGMGEGDGVRDVTEEIEDDKQLEGMQNEKEDGKQEPPPMPQEGEEDKAREVGFDLDAEAQPQPEDEEKKQQKDGEQDEENKELDRQKGDVDLNQGGKLDEKLWNGDEDDEGEDPEQDEKDEKEKDENGKENIEAHGAKGEGEADNMAKEEEEKSKKKEKDQPEESEKNGEQQEGREPAKDEGPVEQPPGCNPEEQESQFDVHMQPPTPPEGQGDGEQGENDKDMELNFENLDGEGGGDGEDLPDPGELGAEEGEEEDANPDDGNGEEDGKQEEGPPEAFAANDAGGEEPEPDQVDACVEGDAAQADAKPEEAPEEEGGPQGTAQESAETEEQPEGPNCQPDPESVSTSRDAQANAAKDQQVFGGAGGAPTPTEAGQQDGRDSAQQQANQQTSTAQGSEHGPKEDLATSQKPQSGDAGKHKRADAKEEGEGAEDPSQRELKKVDVVQAEESGDKPCGEQEDSSAQKGLHMADPKSGMEALAESAELPAGENKAVGAAEEQGESGDEAAPMDEDAKEEQSATDDKSKATAMETMRMEEREEGLDGAESKKELKATAQALQGVELGGDTEMGPAGVANLVAANLPALRTEGGDARMEDIENEGMETHREDEQLGEHRRRSDDEVRQLWCHLEGSTAPLAAALCEQLRAILEPTLKGRLQGHYRTGKRISMRRVIPFIASNYRRDKIWLRRTKPSKREYQVVVAIDNSRSMRECGVAPMALQTLCVVCQALARLEVGEYSVLAFGSQQPRVLLPLGANQAHAATFGWEQARPVLSEFTFDEESANSHNRSLADVMSLSAQLFQERSGNGPVKPFCQAMLIISDGRFNKAKVRPWVHAALSRQQLPLLIVVDSVAGGEPADTGVTQGSAAASSSSSAPKQPPRSIFELKQVSYEGGQCSVTPYLQDFPFPYYVVVQDLQALPKVLGEVLKQWFELAMGS